MNCRAAVRFIDTDGADVRAEAYTTTRVYAVVCYTCIVTHIYIYRYRYIDTDADIDIDLDVDVAIDTDISICVYTRYACMYVCMYVCICICIYIYEYAPCLPSFCLYYLHLVKQQEHVAIEKTTSGRTCCAKHLRPQTDDLPGKSKSPPCRTVAPSRKLAMMCFSSSRQSWGTRESAV